MSIRISTEPTAICGASDGHEIPIGLIGGKNARGALEPEEADPIDLELDGETESAASGDEPAHPTVSTLANNSSTNDDFIPAPFAV